MNDLIYAEKMERIFACSPRRDVVFGERGEFMQILEWLHHEPPSGRIDLTVDGWKKVSLHRMDLDLNQKIQEKEQAVLRELLS